MDIYTHIYTEYTQAHKSLPIDRYSYSYSCREIDIERLLSVYTQYMFICACIYVYVHTCVCIYAHVCVCECLYVGTCVYMFYVHVCDWMPDVYVTMFDEKGRSNKVFII